MVPPGVHLVSYNAVGKHSECGPTTAFFVHVEARSVLVRRWDAGSELLVTLDDEDEV